MKHLILAIAMAKQKYASGYQGKCGIVKKFARDHHDELTSIMGKTAQYLYKHRSSIDKEYPGTWYKFVFGLVDPLHQISAMRWSKRWNVGSTHLPNPIYRYMDYYDSDAIESVFIKFPDNLGECPWTGRLVFMRLERNPKGAQHPYEEYLWKNAILPIMMYVQQQSIKGDDDASDIASTWYGIIKGEF